MNRGAAAASGDVLLFLHADTKLPEGACSMIRESLMNRNVVAGAFRLGFDTARPFLALVSLIASLRTRVLRLPFGDQAIFIRREYFDRIGGYRNFPVMEDLDLMRRIRRRGGRIALLRARVKSSSRRWDRGGDLKTSLMNWRMRMRYRRGEDPALIAGSYYPDWSRDQDRGAAVILFLKLPGTGGVKTRLAAEIGSDAAEALYRCMVRDVFRACSAAGVPVVIAHDGGGGGSDAAEFFGRLPSFPQRGNGLGERMHAAFADCFDLGFSSAVLVGSDVPNLDARSVSRALRLLDRRDMVLGPSRDGGYYLIGFRKSGLMGTVFQDIPWSTGAVMKRTREAARLSCISIAAVRPTRDIDDLDGLRRFMKKNGRRDDLETVRFVNDRNYILDSAGAS